MATPPNPYGGGPSGYGYPYPYPAPYPPPTNSLAIVALVSSLVFAPLGIIFGHISLSQIKRTGEQGRGMALAGLVIGYVVTVLAIIGLAITLVLLALVARDVDRRSQYPYPTHGYTAAPRLDPSIGNLPSFTPPAGLGANCTYPAAPPAAGKAVRGPRTGRVPTTPALVTATISTDHGNIGVRLDNAKSPCTVNSFVSLAQQGYFDGTSCHRLTANNSLSVLQCGDPSGTGSGGPGYSFANEYPTNQYTKGDPALGVPVRYPRGTLAMANAGADTNGSQFFIVYADSKLPPTYTVFGTVDETGLATVDAVAAAGVVGGNLDGKPALPLTIDSIRLD